MKEQKHYLESLDWPVLPIINYRNCIVTKLSNGHFYIWGHEVSEGEEVDRYIDESLLAVSKSIKE